MRISVLLTTWNASWCVTRALDSVFAQTRPADEVIVGDDGSTDDTIAKIANRYGDRVRVLRLAHRGLTPSRRDTFDAATGDWLAPLDADDWWEPRKLERQEAFLDAYPEVRWVGTDGEYVGEEGVIRASWFSDYFTPVRELHGDLLSLLIERCFPLVSSMLIEREAYFACGGYDLTIPYSQDYDLWMKLAGAHAGGMVAEPLIHYWSSPGQLSRKLEARDRDDFELMRRVAAGCYRRDRALQDRGAARAAGLAFEMALRAVKDGRYAEARRAFAGARGRVPARRRLLAWGGSLAPAVAIAALARSGVVRRAAGQARAEVAPIAAARGEATAPVAGGERAR